MNSDKLARLTYTRRLEMVKQRTEQGLGAVEAALAHGVTAPTARKWPGRYLAAGVAGLADASSRPMRSPRAIDASKALLIVELRRRRMLQARIARSVGVSDSTVSRVLMRPSHRVTGNRLDSVNGAGWEMLFVAVDDHARIAFTAMHADEKTPQASSCATPWLLKPRGRPALPPSILFACLGTPHILRQRRLRQHRRHPFVRQDP